MFVNADEYMHLYLSMKLFLLDDCSSSAYGSLVGLYVLNVTQGVSELSNSRIGSQRCSKRIKLYSRLVYGTVFLCVSTTWPIRLFALCHYEEA